MDDLFKNVLMPNGFDPLDLLYKKTEGEYSNHVVSKKDGDLILTIPVPGCDKDDVSVELDNNILSVKATCKYYDDVYSLDIDDSYKLNIIDKCEIDKISADVTDGLLIIKFPYKDEKSLIKNKKIL